MKEHIVLGTGAFYIGATPVGLNRGGGQVVVEREYREMEADGDYGPVKGRINKTKSVCKLTMNAMEMLPSNLVKMYPATQLEVGAGSDTLTGKANIEDADYQEVSWVGKTKAGRAVVIKLENAINLENINWNMVNKEEIVPQVTYTATYDEDDRETEPWSIDFAKGTTYSVTFTVDDGTSPVEGASVHFYNKAILTNASGVAVFTGIPVGNNQPFSITAGGFETYLGSVNVVDANVAVGVSLTEI